MSYIKKKLALQKLRKRRIPLADEKYIAPDNRKLLKTRRNYKKPRPKFQPIDEDNSDDSNNLQILDMPGNVSAAPFGFSIVFVDFDTSRLERMQVETLRPYRAHANLWFPTNEDTVHLGRYVAVIQGAKRYCYNIMQTFDASQPLKYSELAMCLELVREHMLANGCKRVALDRLCCNKAISQNQRLSWSIVRNIIHAAFAYSDIEEVLIYCEEVSRDSSSDSLTVFSTY